jgi:hypothetical protein
VHLDSRGPPFVGEYHQQEWHSASDEGRLRWPSDAKLDVSNLHVLAKNLAKNFMNTFFAECGFRLTLDESVRLSAHVQRSDLRFWVVVPNHLQFAMT